jgi:hypothetical protein
MKTKLTKNQRLAIVCAYCDLVGSKEAKESSLSHDWNAHKRSIIELEKAFPFVKK